MRVVVELDGEVLADTRRSFRVLETSHPPVYYIPAADVRVERLAPSARRSTWCEFKGAAKYYDAGDRGRGRLVLCVAHPRLRGHRRPLRLLSRPGGRATVDGEQVEAQPGDFYGGWITSAVTGPSLVGRQRPRQGNEERKGLASFRATSTRPGRRRAESSSMPPSRSVASPRGGELRCEEFLYGHNGVELAKRLRTRS